jgi:hypothetical protein
VQLFDLYRSGRGQLRAKSVKLMPNNRKLIKEILNCSVNLAKKLLLTNSRKIGKLSSMLNYSIRDPLTPSISPGFYGRNGRGGAV